MNLDARLAYYPNNKAGSDQLADFWLAELRAAIAREEDPRVAFLNTGDRLYRTSTREGLAGALISALERLVELEEQRQYAVRYLTAYRSARQRADAVHQALVEADEERDHLRAQLRDRDEATR